ncbi:hypothetical protein BDV06DRAFT_229386 [Aspergillus oleicola]
MTLLFVGKYKPNGRAIINNLIYTFNTLALTYFVLVGIALRILSLPTRRPCPALGQAPAPTLWFYQIKGNWRAKGTFFVLLISVLIIIALGMDNFLAPAMCIIPEKAAFLVQITKDPQGGMEQVVEGIKESASQIGLFFWFFLLAFILKQGHQTNLYDNPWPALMAFVMTFLVQVLRMEDNKPWKGLLASLVGLAMLFLGVYRGYLVGVDLTWAGSI